MVRLIEQRNERVSKLFNELRQEIRDFEIRRKVSLINPIARIDDSIGTFGSTQALGNCNKKNVNGMTFYFKISVNKLLAQNGTDKDIKDILTHELIYTLSNCFNHKKDFYNKCEMIRFYLGYDGLRNNFEGKYTTPKSERRVIYKCAECGKIFKRFRKINTERYTCPCHGKLIQVS